MAHRRKKPGSISGKAFNVSEATDTRRTFIRIERGHRVIRQRIVLISAVQWVALYSKVKSNKKRLHGRRPVGCSVISKHAKYEKLSVRSHMLRSNAKMS